MSHVNAVAFTILVVSFLSVTLIGFAAAKWRPAEDPMHLDEWGLGGRGFGTFVSWFLLGGDLNLTVAAAGTLLFRVTGVPNGHDETRPEHYTADPGGAPPGQAAGFPAPGRHRRPGPDSLRGGRARQASPAAAARPRAPE